MSKKKGSVNFRQLSDLETRMQAEIDAVEVAAQGDVGTDPTPVTRTNNPIIGTNTVNANVDALDAAIGADANLSILTRQKGQLTANSTILAKISGHEAAIGADADLTPVTRTVGQLALNTSLYAMVEAIDSVIGFDAQMAGTPLDVSKSQSIYQNIDALDAKKTVRTIKKTIGGVGVEGCDYNFTTAANMTEQVITLTNILPGKARLVDVMVVTTAEFTGAVSLGVEVGTSSGGNELKATSDMFALDTIAATANAGAFIIQPTVAARSLYVSATPGANWSLNTAGKLTVYISFVDVTNL